jgi:serine/threonine protein phosphatase 1
MQKDYFIIGDVHGCLKTFQDLIDHAWDKRKEILIQLGDLIDRGAFSPQTLLYCIELENLYPDNTLFLRGNHEQMMLDFYDDMSTSWLANGGRNTLLQFESARLNTRDILPWLKHRNLFFESEYIYVSHAGMAINATDTGNPRNQNGLLWHRGPLQNLGKTQIIGHTPLNDGKPSYNAKSDSWNIDTGAYKGICLTGIKLNHKGQFLEHYSIPTHEADLL